MYTTPLHACNVQCHTKTLSLFPFLCQSTNPREIGKRLDTMEQKLQAQTSDSRQPLNKFVNCNYFHNVNISADAAMQHPVAQALGLGMGKRQTTRLAKYHGTDDSDLDD